MTIKIYELAKELNIASKELVEKINTMGIEAKSHMSSIDDKVAAELRNTLGGKHVTNSETKVVKAVPKKKEKENKQKMLFDGPIFAQSWFNDDTPRVFSNDDNVYTF